MLCLLQTSDIQKRERLSRGASWLKYSFCLTPAHPECSVFSADDSLSGNLLFQAKAQVLLGSQDLLCVLRVPQGFRQGQAAGRGSRGGASSFLLELLACLSSLCPCDERRRPAGAMVGSTFSGGPVLVVILMQPQ